MPVILMMGFVPLLVHMYSYNSNLSQFDWFPANSDTQTDFFFAWKMIAIVIIGVVMAAILLYRHYVKKETLQFENSFYFLMVYGLFVLMSALFSKHKHWVSGGTYELFESVWVVFAYMLLCYYVYNFVNDVGKISEAIVIILYMLRCCLAHGDISPDESANEVYKYAYEVLCAPLKKLK